MGRTVKKLSGLEIDEVSLVDRPANQHGLVAIAKNDQEDDVMGEIFDAHGNEVDEEELQHGDVVYDGSGEELVYVEQEVDGGDDDDDEDEGQEFGKAGGWLARAGTKARSLGEGAEFYGDQARRKAQGAQQYGRKAVQGTKAGYRAGASGGERNIAVRGGRKNALRGAGYDAGYLAGRHPRAVKYGAAGVGATGVAGGTAYGADRHFRKSLGDAVMEELSKSLTDNDRNEVIAKAMDLVEGVAKRNEQLELALGELVEEREAEGFYELAKGYELPIDPEGIGGLMHRAAQVMDPEDLSTLDRLFSSVGEISKSGGFEQVGYDGWAESDVLSQVYAVAGEAVAKGDGALTQEQAITALFAANPAAYDEYELEQRRR